MLALQSLCTFLHCALRISPAPMFQGPKGFYWYPYIDLAFAQMEEVQEIKRVNREGMCCNGLIWFNVCVCHIIKAE